jgi:glycosyltransferase involved in cell wall biosynthesis
MTALPLQPRPAISLCMIVKDESACMSRCLESVRTIVSEMIIADTGSTDDTVAIARAAGAQVFDFSWQDDFAAARNATIERASGDWILVLDADELIAPADLARFPALTSDRSRCIEFLQRHYTDDIRLSNFVPCQGEFPELEQGHAGYFESGCVRLFPNHAGLSYRFRIHELVEPSIAEKGVHTIERTAVRIHHYGHSTAVKNRRSKAGLYGALGARKAAERPEDWKAFFELGVEANTNGRYEESITAFRSSLKLNPSYVQSWCNLGYVLMMSEKFSEAAEALSEALKLDPRSAEAYCNLGALGLRSKDLALAERASARAIALNPLYVNALRNLARCYLAQNRAAECALVLKRAHAAVPQFTPILGDLYLLYRHAGINQTAEKYLARVHAIDPRLATELTAVEIGASAGVTAPAAS